MQFYHPSEITVPPDRFRPADSAHVDRIAKSIEEIGQVQAILINNTEEKVLVAGLHRLLGCKQLGRKVWAVTEADGNLVLNNPLLRKAAEYQENYCRKQCTPEEDAFAVAEIHRLMTEIYGARPKGRAGTGHDGWTQQDTADKLGFKSHKTVSNAITIAHAVQVMPQLKEAKTTAEAMNIIKHTVRMEAAVELARREAEKGGIEIPDPAKFFGDRLILGNCLDKIKQLPQNVCNLFITDPPFALKLDKLIKDRGEQLGAAQTVYEDHPDDILPLLQNLIPEISRIGKESCQIVMFCAMEYWSLLRGWFTDAGFKVYRKPLIWVKAGGDPFKLQCGRVNNPDTHPGSAYEGAIYVWRGSATLALPGLPDVFIHLTPREKFHIAQKPLSLMKEIISRFYRPGTNPMLIDLFAGSGSTLVAAHQLGIRNYLGYELNPEFRERALSYMIQSYMDGEKAVQCVSEVDMEDFQ